MLILQSTKFKVIHYEFIKRILESVIKGRFWLLLFSLILELLLTSNHLKLSSLFDDTCILGFFPTLIMASMYLPILSRKLLFIFLSPLRTRPRPPVKKNSNRFLPFLSPFRVIFLILTLVMIHFSWIYKEVSNLNSQLA